MGQSRRQYSILSGLLLVALTLLVYGAGLSGGFIFDDFANLVFDPDWKVTSFKWSEIWNALTNGVASPAGRPLAIASFAINHALTGMDPFWLKLTSLLIHAGNGLLAWVLCRGLFAHLYPQGEPARPGAWTALIVATAWLLHPLQASTVLYIVQRMELGAATGTLLALIFYVQGRKSQMRGDSGWPWLIPATLAALLGLGFKETALLVPGFALIIELCVLRFRRYDGGLSRGWLITYSVGVIAAIFLFFTVALPMSGPDSAYLIRDFDRKERMMTQLPVLTLYLQQIMVPIPESMGFYYDNFPVSHSLTEPATAMAGILLALLLACACIAWQRWPLVALGILWFFVAHTLTSNVLPLELAFEHRNYLALLGILISLVTPAHAAALRLNKSSRVIALSAPLFGLCVLCWIQASTWGEPIRLAWALENRNPSSSRAVYGLGRELLLSSNNDTSSPAWSLAHAKFVRAAELSDRSALPLQGVLLMDGRQGRIIPASLWEDFRTTLTRQRISPGDLGALYAVSDCQIQGECRFDHGELLTTFLAVLTKNPNSPEVHTIYANFAWNVLNDKDLAINVQREAVRLSPTYPSFQIALAKFLLASDDPARIAEGHSVVDSLRGDGYDLAATGINEAATFE